MASALDFVFSNLLLIATGLFGVGGVLMLLLVWLGLLPGRELLSLPWAAEPPAEDHMNAPPPRSMSSPC